MRRSITVEYNNRLWMISGIGIAAAASPIDEPMCANVEKRDNRYKICLVYMRSLEETQTMVLQGVSIKYGEKSGRILMYNELMSSGNIPTLTECLDALIGEQNISSMRIYTNLRSSISAIRRIKNECK